MFDSTCRICRAAQKFQRASRAICIVSRSGGTKSETQTVPYHKASGSRVPHGAEAMLEEMTVGEAELAGGWRRVHLGSREERGFRRVNEGLCDSKIMLLGKGGR